MAKVSIRGRSCYELSVHAIEFLKSSAGPVKTLILAPVRAAADDLIRRSGIAATRGIHRHTLRDFVLTVANAPMNDRGLVPISRLGRECLAAHVADQASTAHKLEYLDAVVRFPGFARALARTLEELRLNQVSEETLKTTGRSGSDLAFLLSAYETELRERKLADHAARVRLATEAIRAGVHDFAGALLVLFDVRPQTRLEQNVLAELCERSSAVLELTPGSNRQPENALATLQMYALSGELPRPDSADGSVEIFSASGEALECVEITRRILQAASRGLRFDQLGVLLRNPGRYQPLVAEAFSRARVPAWFALGVNRPDPSGRAFLALLRCAEHGLSASGFSEYLSLEQMPAEAGELRAPAAWERMLVDAAVVGSAERWERRLEGLLEFFKTSSRDTEQLEALRIFALPLISLLAELPRVSLWGEWLQKLREVALRALKAPEPVLDLLDELSPMASIGPVSLGELLVTLAPGLSTQRLPSEGERYGKVFVGSIEEARGMSFAETFIPGLNEGLFPQLRREDPLFLDEQRAKVSLPPVEDDGQLLRSALATAQWRVTASWSRIDLATGRERVPSFYAFELYEAARGGDTDLHRFAQEALRGSQTRLGWPAPADPVNAIDDVEYDLALLRPAWEARTPGAAAYLGSVNPHVIPALRARWLRWNKKWRWADGLVCDNEVVPALDRLRLSERTYSPTELEQYARCPYRFLLRSVYHLKPAETAVAIQLMEPSVRGELFHAIQFAFYNEASSAGLLPVTSGNMAEAVQILDRVIDDAAREAEDRYAPAIDQLWGSQVDDVRADLHGWLRHAAANHAGWTPEHFEWTFGKPPVTILGAYQIHGRVDLIERNEAGQLRVVDHKTGRLPDKPPLRVGGGESLQPLLYALAASSVLGQPVVEAHLFYSTLRQNYREIVISPNAAAQEAAQKILDTINAAIQEGFLPAAPRAAACKSCDYLPVCGPYEEERTNPLNKDPGRLKPLVQIRALP